MSNPVVDWLGAVVALFAVGAIVFAFAGVDLSILTELFVSVFTIGVFVAIGYMFLHPLLK